MVLLEPLSSAAAFQDSNKRPFRPLGWSESAWQSIASYDSPLFWDSVLSGQSGVQWLIDSHIVHLCLQSQVGFCLWEISDVIGLVGCFLFGMVRRLSEATVFVTVTLCIKDSYVSESESHSSWFVSFVFTVISPGSRRVLVLDDERSLNTFSVVLSWACNEGNW